jgi:hypothetical protein
MWRSLALGSHLPVGNLRWTVVRGELVCPSDDSDQSIQDLLRALYDGLCVHIRCASKTNEGTPVLALLHVMILMCNCRHAHVLVLILASTRNRPPPDSRPVGPGACAAEAPAAPATGKCQGPAEGHGPAARSRFVPG